MEASGCRCDAANQDLLDAKQGYETRAAARNKRKVAELEAKVKQAEEGRTEEDIAGEVNWLRDPGTPSKILRKGPLNSSEGRKLAHQNAHSQSLDTVENEKQHMATEVNLTEEQMGKIINYNNSLEGRINIVHEAVQIVNRKLTFLIQILRDMVNAAPGASQPAKTEAKDNESIEAMQASMEYSYATDGAGYHLAMQARMDTHMDTISQMGKFI